MVTSFCPTTIGDYIARTQHDGLTPDTVEFKETETETRARIGRFFSGNGKRTAASFHRELGTLDDRGVWNVAKRRGATLRTAADPETS